jgi:hypothetical protein
VDAYAAADVSYYAVNSHTQELYVHDFFCCHFASTAWAYVTIDSNFFTGANPLSYLLTTVFEWNEVYKDPEWNGTFFTVSELHGLRATLAFFP